MQCNPLGRDSRGKAERERPSGGNKEKTQPALGWLRLEGKNYWGLPVLLNGLASTAAGHTMRPRCLSFVCDWTSRRVGMLFIWCLFSCSCVVEGRLRSGGEGIYGVDLCWPGMRLRQCSF